MRDRVARPAAPLVRPAALLGALLVACLHGSARSGAEESAWTPYDALLPGRAEGFDGLLVLDEATQRPVEGARVESRWENDYENGAWAPLASSGTTDAHGIYCAKTPERDGPRHWEVRAPGYEPLHEYSLGAVDEVLELRHAVPKHGRIVDIAGRPLAGVTVAWKVGCAHAPTHGSALSDVTGRFVLPDGPDQADIGIYAGPGVEFSPYCVEVVPTWAEPPWTVAWPGIEVVGEIVPPHGRHPLTLASRQETQGPILELQPDGEFRLPNVEWGTTLEVWNFVPPDTPADTPRDGTAAEPSIPLEEWTPGAAIRFSPTQRAPQEPTCRVLVQLEGARPEDETPVKVHFDRPDGRRFSFDVLASTEIEDPQLTLPVGTYTVRLDAPFAPYHALPLALRAGPEGGTTTVRMALLPSTELRLPFGDAQLAAALGATTQALAHMHCYVAAREPLSGAWRALDRSLGADEEPLYVTPSCEVTSWARGPMGTVRFQLLEREGDVRRVAWTTEPGGGLDIVGGPAEQSLRPSLEVGIPHSWEELEGGLRLRVAQPGRYVLTEDGVRTVVQVPPYAPGKEPSRLEASALRRTPADRQRLDIRLPAGLAAGDDLEVVRIQVVRLDGPDAGTRWWRLEGCKDDATRGDGVVTLRDALLAPGATVHAPMAMPWIEDAEGVAQHPGFDLAPQVIRLEGEGPWTYEFPARGLDLRVRLTASAEDRKPISFSVGDVLVALEGRIYAAQPQADGSGLLRVRGLPSGPLRMAVTAKGHEGRQRLVTPPGDGVIALEVDVPLRR